jgi:hypothetical protein
MFMFFLNAVTLGKTFPGPPLEVVDLDQINITRELYYFIFLIMGTGLKKT